MYTVFLAVCFALAVHAQDGYGNYDPYSGYGSYNPDPYAGYNPDPYNGGYDQYNPDPYSGGYDQYNPNPYDGYGGYNPDPYDTMNPDGSGYSGYGNGGYWPDDPYNSGSGSGSGSGQMTTTTPTPTVTGPCKGVTCKSGEKCIVKKTKTGRIFAKCVPTWKEGTCPSYRTLACTGTYGGAAQCSVDADCRGKKKCCRSCGTRICALPQAPRDPGYGYGSGSGSGDMSTPNPVACPAYFADCSTYCRHGAKYTTDRNGCPRCDCVVDPCKGMRCAAGEVCVLKKTSTGRSFRKCVQKVKSGRCPQTDYAMMMMPCAMDMASGAGECQTDPDCRGKKKCCSGACGMMQCVLPQETPITKPVTRSGQCPYDMYSMMGAPCAYMNNPYQGCQHDGDCRMGQKCCTTMCSRTCQTALLPAKVKPGQCPQQMSMYYAYAGATGYSGGGSGYNSECSNDGHCGSGARKCCSSADGSMKCMQPATNQPDMAQFQYLLRMLQQWMQYGGSTGNMGTYRR